jgi:hypothetical protein
MAATDKSPINKGYQPITWNFKLLANDMLGGFGGMGEGMSVQIAPDGRKWCARPICRTPICARTRWRPAAT